MMRKRAIKWVLGNCKFASLPPDQQQEIESIGAALFALYSESPDETTPEMQQLEARKAELDASQAQRNKIMNGVPKSLSLLGSEGLDPDVDIEQVWVDKGSRGSYDEPGYGAFIEDIDGTMSIEGQNILQMIDEADFLGLSSPQEAWEMISQFLPMNITVHGRASPQDFDITISGEMTITGLGPLNPDGSCQFSYSPNPIPITDWDHL